MAWEMGGIVRANGVGIVRANSVVVIREYALQFLIICVIIIKREYRLLNLTI